MSTPERCLAQAQEAERLAEVVSYERDRTRLRRQAAEWRERAAALQAEEPPPAEAPPSPLRRLTEALFGPRRPRGG